VDRIMTDDMLEKIVKRLEYNSHNCGELGVYIKLGIAKTILEDMVTSMPKREECHATSEDRPSKETADLVYPFHTWLIVAVGHFGRCVLKCAANARWVIEESFSYPFIEGLPLEIGVYDCICEARKSDSDLYGKFHVQSANKLDISEMD
jgi:hypothetical protein